MLNKSFYESSLSLHQPSAYHLTIYRYAIIVSFSKYHYRIFFDNITRYLSNKHIHWKFPSVLISEAFFRWKWHKKSKYTLHKWSLTGKYRFPKKVIIYVPFCQLSRVAGTLLMKKPPQSLTIFALVKYGEYHVIIVSIPKISCNIVWTRKNISQRVRGGQKAFIFLETQTNLVLQPPKIAKFNAFVRNGKK